MTILRKRPCSALLILTLIAAVLVSSYCLMHYLALKHLLLEKLSTKITALIDQPVRVGDISFVLPGMINVYDVEVKNPRDFPSGYLLRIESISVTLDPWELLKKRFILSSIVVLMRIS